jgi:uncharacterized protein YchJ
MSTRRNDACPCGSGKKYQHCCLKAADDAGDDAGDLVWRRLRRANEGLVAKQMRFFIESYGDEVFSEAWEEFLLWPRRCHSTRSLQYNRARGFALAN